MDRIGPISLEKKISAADKHKICSLYDDHRQTVSPPGRPTRGPRLFHHHSSLEPIGYVWSVCGAGVAHLLFDFLRRRRDAT